MCLTLFIQVMSNSANTWTGVSGVNINMDNLSFASNYQKSNAPSMNQLSKQSSVSGTQPMMGIARN